MDAEIDMEGLFESFQSSCRGPDKEIGRSAPKKTRNPKLLMFLRRYYLTAEFSFHPAMDARPLIIAIGAVREAALIPIIRVLNFKFKFNFNIIY